MARNYVGNDSVRFTLSGLCTVDMEVYGGETVRYLTPKRLFPVTGETKYISLLDSEEHEVAIIRDLDTLMKESREAVEKALGEYYFVPKITAIKEITDKFGALKFSVSTDKGNVEFTVKNRHYDIKKLQNERVLIRDSNDNRYEIEDYTLLDKASRKALYQYV